MTYAIIETGGKQLRVEPGRFYDVERLPVEEDETITIDRILFVDHDGDVSIGQPLVEGATVEATVMRHFRGRKIIVYKMRPKKKTRKKQGHRQELTRLMVNSISLNGSTSDASTEEAISPAVVMATDENPESPIPEEVKAAQASEEPTSVEATLDETPEGLEDGEE